MLNYKNIISYDPNRRFGKPCIRETRITVYDVLGWLASGMSFDQIKYNFPEITDIDILASLSYAAERERKLQIA